MKMIDFCHLILLYLPSTNFPILVIIPFSLITSPLRVDYLASLSHTQLTVHFLWRDLTKSIPQA